MFHPTLLLLLCQLFLFHLIFFTQTIVFLLLGLFEGLLNARFEFFLNFSLKVLNFDSLKKPHISLSPNVPSP